MYDVYTFGLLLRASSRIPQKGFPGKAELIINEHCKYRAKLQTKKYNFKIVKSSLQN